MKESEKKVLNLIRKKGLVNLILSVENSELNKVFEDDFMCNFYLEIKDWIYQNYESYIKNIRIEYDLLEKRFVKYGTYKALQRWDYGIKQRLEKDLAMYLVGSGNYYKIDLFFDKFNRAYPFPMGKKTMQFMQDLIELAENALEDNNKINKSFAENKLRKCLLRLNEM